MEQLFRLNGVSIDLDHLMQLFPTGVETIKKIEDNYYLRFEPWTATKNNTEALNFARRALARLNGVAMIEQESFRPVEIVGITDRDAATGKLATRLELGVQSAVSRSHASTTLTLVLEDGTTVTTAAAPLTFGTDVSALMKTNDRLERALEAFGSHNEQSWSVLYLVYDAIQGHFGGENELKKQNFVTSGEIKKFKATAQSFDALGVEARHANHPGVPEAQIKLNEARQLIRKLLDSWIKQLL
jgi:hypothetical protein